nr:conjugative transfer protein [Salmonella sp. NCTC 7297]
MSDYGIALAKQFVVGEVPVSIGVTPKLQKTWLYNYTTSIYNYDSSDWNSSRYRNDDTGFNVDAGLAADIGENWTLGLSGQNLVSRDIDTKDIYITNGMTGETTNYKDTYQIRPLVTAGVAWHKRFADRKRRWRSDGKQKALRAKTIHSTLVLALKFDRYHGWRCAQGIVRMVKNNDSNVVTGGLGFAPFNRCASRFNGTVRRR